MSVRVVLLCCSVLTGHSGLLLAADVAADVSVDISTDIPTDPAAIENRLVDAMTLLPEGDGKTLTAIACSRCHDLGGLKAYKGYWSRAQWLAMVESMVKNGAALDAAQMQTVTDYLNQQYGRESH